MTADEKKSTSDSSSAHHRKPNMAILEDLKIPSSRRKLSIALTIYRRNDTKSCNVPTIIMGHGIGAIKDGGLAPFATAFASEGYAAVTFDYLSFGMSDGEPRNLMAVSDELQDFRDVIAWVRSQPQRFDATRIVVWGTSFGGMHTTELLAEDHELACGIAQCPCVDGLAASFQLAPLLSLKLTFAALYDLASSFFSTEPHYVHLTGDGASGSPPATMMGLEVVEGWERITPADVPFPNKIAAGSLLSILCHRPILRAHRSKKPYLIVLPTWDGQAPLAAAEQVVLKAPLGEALNFRSGYFDLYHSGPAFEENLAGQLSFLKRVIGT